MSITATPATLPALLKAAKPGDVITLDGVFGQIGLRNREGLTFRGGTVAGLRFDLCHGMTVDGTCFVGPDAPDGNGLFAVGVSGLTVTGCSFESYKNGIALSKVDGFEIVGNGFARMRSDGVQGGEVRNGRIAHNVMHGTKITGDEHPDGVQLWSRPTSPPTADVVIEDNTIVGMTQGISCFNHVRNGVDDGGFDRITIRKNRIVGGYPHGIALDDGRDCVIADNEVETYPTARWQAKINIDGGSGLVRSGNTVGAGAGRVAINDPAR